VTAQSALLERAADYIWRNARLLERRLFECLFGRGGLAAVTDALLAYRNADGGFGNALEPDMRGPDSQPGHVEFAFRVLDDSGALDDALARPALDWLFAVALEDGGVPDALPSVSDYPSAPWWREGAGRASPTVTASITGLSFKHGLAHPWLERAAAFCWRDIERASDDVFEFHSLRALGEFLRHAPDRGRAEAAAARLAPEIRARGKVETVAEHGAYAKTPLMWAPAPDACWRRAFSDDETERDLEELAARQDADGGWPLGFPLTSPAAEHEWRGRFTIDALLKLRAYGRLD
jgi:hypothetical protein